MTITLVSFAAGLAFFWGIRKAVAAGARDAQRPRDEEPRRGGYRWHNPNDKRAR